MNLIGNLPEIFINICYFLRISEIKNLSVVSKHHNSIIQKKSWMNVTVKLDKRIKYDESVIIVTKYNFKKYDFSNLYEILTNELLSLFSNCHTLN